MGSSLVTKKRIGVLMGGLSSERDVSVRTGLAIYQSLQESGYNVALIDVNRDIVQLLKREKIRLAFLALHGGTGEDGSIQGLLEVMGIPYTGSGVLASALAMDKEVSKKIFAHHDIPVAPYVVIRKKKGSTKHGKKIAQEKEAVDITGAYIYPDFPLPGFDLPWVVKPAAEGSSIGVTIARTDKELESCLEKAFAYGDRVIIEKFVKGKEINIGVLGDKPLGGVEVRPSLEFYSYEAKYTSGLTDYIIPPEIDEKALETLNYLALKAHMCLGCSGATRVDFIIDEKNNPFILEVNTLPGMTTTSLLPKIAKVAGLSFRQLLEEIIKIAVKE